MYHLGRLPSPPDDRDHKFSLYVNTSVLILPPIVSAPAYPRLDQLDTPECVAFSGALTKSIAEKRDEHKRLLFDAPELYARCKEQDGAPNEEGTDIRVACDILLKRGALVTDSTRKSDIGSFKPISAYARLTSIKDIQAAIFIYGDAWFGSGWYNSWFDPTKGGYLPEPDYLVGGHAYTAVGYSDKRQAFRIQNSWGEGWAQKGRAWMPYKYFDFNGDFEAWRTIDVLGD